MAIRDLPLGSNSLPAGSLTARGCSWSLLAFELPCVNTIPSDTIPLRKVEVWKCPITYNRIPIYRVLCVVQGHYELRTRRTGAIAWIDSPPKI